jgi:hypothetical protein
MDTEEGSIKEFNTEFERKFRRHKACEDKLRSERRQNDVFKDRIDMEKEVNTFLDYYKNTNDNFNKLKNIQELLTSFWSFKEQ